MTEGDAQCERDPHQPIQPGRHHSSLDTHQTYSVHPGPLRQYFLCEAGRLPGIADLYPDGTAALKHTLAGWITCHPLYGLGAKIKSL